MLNIFYTMIQHLQSSGEECVNRVDSHLTYGIKQIEKAIGAIPVEL